MKILTAIGNKEIQERIRESSLNIIDEVDSIEALEELVELMPMEVIIINHLLDEEGQQLIKISQKARGKGIKMVLLINSFKDAQLKKLIGILVNEGVTAYVELTAVTPDLIENILHNYPKEFDYSQLADIKEYVKVERVVESVFKEVIAVYSPLSQGATTTATHLAYTLALTKKCRVCIVDYNPLKPAFKKAFKTTFEYTLVDVLDAVTRQNLTYERMESFPKAYKLLPNLDILPGIYNINDYYSSSALQYKEIIEKLKFNYDYVVIDTHSWFDVISSDVALKLADKVLIPLLGNPYDVEETNRYIEEFNRYNDYDTSKFYFVINQYGDNDLTFVELQSKVMGKIVGYVSQHKTIEAGNGIKDKKVINQYIEILNNIGIKANKKTNILDYLRMIR